MKKISKLLLLTTVIVAPIKTVVADPEKVSAKLPIIAPKPLGEPIASSVNPLNPPPAPLGSPLETSPERQLTGEVSEQIAPSVEITLIQQSTSPSPSDEKAEVKISEPDFFEMPLISIVTSEPLTPPSEKGATDPVLPIQLTEIPTVPAPEAHAPQQIQALPEKVPVRLTFYSGKDDQWGSRVAWDKVKRAERGRTVAADPALFPYGTWIHIPGFGDHRVEDTGTAVKSRKASAGKDPVIDIYVGEESEVLRLTNSVPEYVEITLL